ncbi:putative testis-expressed protein 13C [Drosophila serrata]|uniref:putative testis-expressed protein 13C n=1 Tax=Drosophila serrata TaxID=7274 RepID=UPI000A1D0D07|nr:putative testis-expressed protein 13C [Drosophila serrata]
MVSFGSRGTTADLSLKFYVIALAFVGLVAADVSHLKLGQSVDGGYGLSASSSSSLSSSYLPPEHTSAHLKTAEVVPGGDSSSYQPAEYTPAHLRTAEVVPGGDSSSYQPAEYTPAHLKTAEVVPGGDSSSYQPAEYTPEHLKTAEVVPGGDSSSYQPAEYTPEHLKTAEVVPGGDSSSYQPAEYTPAHLRTAEVVPGGDSSSYQPAEYTPAHLKTAEVIPGGDSSSYQPAEYTPAHLKTSVPAPIGAHTHAPVPAAIGADTYTPEKFIPQADREAHYKYIQEQQQQTVVPGGDSSSYQPAEYTPAHLKKASFAAVATEVIPGGDSSSYQPAEYTPAHLKTSVPAPIGADTYTPEQFIPQADREAHYRYIQQEQTVVPGGDSSSYQPAEYTPQNLKTSTVVQTTYVQSQAKAIVPTINQVHSYVQGHAAISNQLQAPIAAVASRVYEEPSSNGIEEFNPETHVPVVIGADTITPAHLRTGGQGTQYAANGGYVY